MTASVFDSLIFGGLFTDDTVAAQFEDREQIRSMLRVEAALAIAEARVGLIPGEAAQHIDSVARTLDPDPSSLSAATTRDGVPVTALIDSLREAVGDSAADFVHWGATSQDIMDTSLVLRMREVTAILDQRLAGLVDTLLTLARRHAGTPMLGRTRSQGAVPTSFGLKAAGWAAPLQRHRTRLAELKPRVLAVQLGGAAGTRSVLGEHGMRVLDELARELTLACPVLPWHSHRDGMAELAGWLSLVTGSLAKLGQDIILLTQTGISEVRVGGGGSSTMPRKNNPVGAELLVALGRHNAVLLGEMHQAMIHDHERDGAAWNSEWLSLPQMAVSAGTAIARARVLIDGLTVDTQRMSDNLQALNGLACAEAALFALARHMPRREARQLVNTAVERTGADGGHLLDRLAALTDADVDWEALKHPSNQITTAITMLEQFLDPGAADS
ncbi:MAG: 3-carboxy-cis,cis-muconate cycloisomerase [Gammaproteobacteria bacterium]|nr:3-carboxy-cis,cis-muconate cycloisomerase [Gammaproteobacteria bacterium]